MFYLALQLISLSLIALTVTWVMNHHENGWQKQESEETDVEAKEKKAHTLPVNGTDKAKPAVKSPHRTRSSSKNGARQQETSPKERSSRRREVDTTAESRQRGDESRRKWPAEAAEPGPSTRPASSPKQKQTEAVSPTSHRPRKRALEEVADDQDDEKDTSSRRVSKRLPKRNKRDDSDHEEANTSMTITLPGGYEDIEVDVGIEDAPKPKGQRRKREEAELDGDEDEDNDGDTLTQSRRRLQGRAVRRRREQGENGEDQEMPLVQSSSRRSKQSRRRRATPEETDSEMGDMELDGESPHSVRKGLRATPFNETSEDEEDSEEDNVFDAGVGRITTPRRRNKLAGNGLHKKDTRTATSAKKRKAVAAAAKKASKVPARMRGETWTEPNGQSYRISTRDGMRRKLVALKQWRHKYHMPLGSVHPDKDVMHQVLVEKWITDKQETELRRMKLLGWQSDDEESFHGNIDDVTSKGNVQVEPEKEKVQLNNSLYNYEQPLFPASPSSSKIATPGSLRSSQKILLRPEVHMRPTVLRAHRVGPTFLRTSEARSE